MTFLLIFMYIFQYLKYHHSHYDLQITRQQIFNHDSKNYHIFKLK